MSEAGFTLFQNIVEGMESILYALCLTTFFHPFMTKGKNKNPAKTIKMLIVFLAYAAIYFLNLAIGMNGWLCMLVVIILLTVVSCYLGMDRKFGLLLGVLFFCIRNLCVLSVTSVNFYMGRYFVQREDTMEMVLRNTALNFCLVELIQMILFVILLYYVRCQLKKCKMELHVRELCYLLLTPITGILFGNIVFRMMLIVISDHLVMQLYEQYPLLLGIVPMVAILFYVGILATIVSYLKMAGLQEEKKKYFVEQQQVHAIQERIEEVEQFYDGIRRMKHEMKNHLTNIKGLVRNGSYEDIEQYIDQMDESMNVFELNFKTGNTITDVIVNDRQKAAVKQGIQFQTGFIYPKSEWYNAYDIGIIINNLLQNALEACGRMSSANKYISISSRQKKKFFLIEVRNSYEGEIVMDADTNLPISTKGAGKSCSLHGIGLSNVKREADKYMGDVDIKVKKNEFSVTVLLQERIRT